jgi:hypothetical protein
MDIPRINSSDCQAFISGQRIVGVQSFDLEQPLEFEPISKLGFHSVQDRVRTPNQKINVNLECLLIESGIVHDPFFNFDSDFLSVNPFDIKLKDLAGEYSISGAYLTEYGLSVNLGEPAKVSVGYEALGFSGNKSGISYLDQTNDTGSVFTTHNVRVSGDHKIQGSISSTSLILQSFNLNVPIPRNPITVLGQRVPHILYPELPTNGTLTFEAIKNEITGIDFAPLLLEKSPITLKLRNCNQGVRYKVNNCSLINITEGETLDGDATLNFNYEFSIDNNAIDREAANFIFADQIVYGQNDNGDGGGGYGGQDWVFIYKFQDISGNNLLSFDNLILQAIEQ